MSIQRTAKSANNATAVVHGGNTMTETKLHLGCGKDIKDGWINVDQLDGPGVDRVLDLEHTPWPWAEGSVDRIQANHVFEHIEDIENVLRECERVLTPRGILTVRVPVGLDSWADPDHEHQWEWRTPTFYCGARPWDVDVGLQVIDRNVELWPAGQTNLLAAIDKLTWKFREFRDGQGPWMFNQPGSCGEFTVRFQNP